MFDTPSVIVDLLKMNAAVKNMNRDAMQCLTRSKILMSHPDLDMQPLFVYNLKLLPLIMNWFRRSSQLRGDKVGVWRESLSKLRRRELSAYLGHASAATTLVLVCPIRPGRPRLDSRVLLRRREHLDPGRYRRVRAWHRAARPLAPLPPHAAGVERVPWSAFGRPGTFRTFCVSLLTGRTAGSSLAGKRAQN